MTAMHSFQHLYLNTLKELYQIEFQFAASLPRLGGLLSGTELESLSETCRATVRCSSRPARGDFRSARVQGKLRAVLAHVPAS